MLACETHYVSMMLRTVHSSAGSSVDIIPLLGATVSEIVSDSIEACCGRAVECESGSHSESGELEVHQLDDAQMGPHNQDGSGSWYDVGDVASDASSFLYVESHHPDTFQWQWLLRSHLNCEIWHWGHVSFPTSRCHDVNDMMNCSLLPWCHCFDKIAHVRF